MAEKEQIFLVDDDQDVLDAYCALLEMEGYAPQAFTDPQQALDALEPDWPGVVVSDIYMPVLSGWQLLQDIRDKDKHLPVILITGHGDVPMAIEAMQQGAFYFIEKPVEPERLLTQIRQALLQRRRYLSLKSSQQQELELQFIGRSSWIKQLRAYLQQLAETDLPVFIFGQPGSGRSLTARYLYKLSQPRFSTCKTLELLSDYDDEQLQQYLAGLAEGVLIIKNIEHLSEAAQKVLTQYIHYADSKLRIIALSRYSPQQLLTESKLLPELFYAFSLTCIECIPLSRRPADIEVLFRHYLELTCRKLNKRKPQINADFIKKLTAQPWPGNITQLIHTAELYAVGVRVRNEDLHFIPERQDGLSLDNRIDEYEKKVITDVLDMFQGKINDAAAYLQIPRKKLYLRMKKYALNKADYKE
ncbi:two-component system phosphoglycerate transport system response regulator PgtA [Mesocricetibacter intestinalis]|uniref:Two-component system phosphoglycerate transport system response regulator PgtA n=1 Tax=Mesocricetibacter intestinalis TaxID=1521930 RepID=A0A4R6V849_9PAST|nr:response regulator [Mesocricetibacter intestinalis]TDQ57405.1 two-component system phosphoglycerate transport system response regulator PgtA [Mesocricetibacter intestinalis]